MRLAVVDGSRDDATVKRGPRARCTVCDRITRRLTDVGGGPRPDEAQWVPFCAHCEGEHDRTIPVGVLRPVVGGGTRRALGGGGGAA